MGPSSSSAMESVAASRSGRTRLDESPAWPTPSQMITVLKDVLGVNNRMTQKLSTKVTNDEPELIVDYACETGENPLWHPIERRLYWTDIPNGRLFCYNPIDGFHEQCYQGRPVGGFTVQSDGSLLLFMDRGMIAVWRRNALLEVISEIPEEQSSCFNDVIADPCGRVFCGIMSTPERKGRLYRLDLDGSLHLLLEGIGCSNGMAFSRDSKSFYYTDSFAREIYLFDYDIEDGAICNQRVFADFSKADGLPDGVTMDADGQLWSALWDGACVVRLLLNGEIEKRIMLPTREVSSLTFGGDNYTDLYITTAGGNHKEVNGPLAGGLFRVKGQVPGLPEFFSRINTTTLNCSLRLSSLPNQFDTPSR
jgi:sugar lactone lactonase YvrE